MSTAPQPLVYCVILNWNGGTLLLDTLESVGKMTYENRTVLVVDNGSTDGSMATALSQHPRVEVIENGANLGFGEGNNAGIRTALDRGAEWVFLLNSDIIVDPLLLSELMAVAGPDPRIGIVGPKIYYHSQPSLIWYAGGRINYFAGVNSHRGIRRVDRGQYDTCEDTDYVTGCALLIRRAALETAGMFDPAFSPAYGEDADLCVRVAGAGYRIVYVPQGRLWHRVSAFSGGGLTPLKTRLKVEHSLIFLQKHARWYHWLFIPWCVGAGTIAFLGRELLRGNLPVVKALVQGYGHALRRILSR